MHQNFVLVYKYVKAEVLSARHAAGIFAQKCLYIILQFFRIYCTLKTFLIDQLPLCAATGTRN